MNQPDFELRPLIYSGFGELYYEPDLLIYYFLDNHLGEVFEI